MREDKQFTMTKEEAIKIVQGDPLVIQFKNTIKYISGSTNMTLDRLNMALDIMCASIFTQGMTRGVKEVHKILDEEESRAKSSKFHPVTEPKNM